jgi:hypothetical protein
MARTSQTEPLERAARFHARRLETARAGNSGEAQDARDVLEIHPTKIAFHPIDGFADESPRCRNGQVAQPGGPNQDGISSLLDDI